ncbi:MAG: S-layer homology domain-containing protein, partial [Anaerotignum sp.]|nr:S-layer homology domain-containing protein [Anaerotignum sp.]
TTAYYGDPWDITPYLNGYAVTDTAFNVVRYISEAKVSTIVGSGDAGYQNGSSVKTAFNGPTGLATDADGNLYVADTQNNVIRKVDTTGEVTTFAGMGKEGYQDGTALGSQFNQPVGLDWEDGVLYVADSGNQRIRKIENGMVTTLAGTAGYYLQSEGVFEGGYQDGSAALAQFSSPMDVLASKGAVYVADSGNSAVRKIEQGTVSTVVINAVPAFSVYPTKPSGLAFLDGMLYVTDPFAGLVYSVSDALAKDTTSGDGVVIFKDVNDKDWFNKAVMFMYDRNLISGTGDKQFSPNQNMTRGMFVTVMGRISEGAGETIANSGCDFSDVQQDMYYAKYIQWAKENGIISGGDGLFYPEKNITRQEMLVMLKNLADHMGKDTTPGSKTVNGFNDFGQIEPWAVGASNWAYSNGIISGRDGNLLAPKATATRAEVSQIFMKYLQNIK